MSRRSVSRRVQAQTYEGTDRDGVLAQAADQARSALWSCGVNRAVTAAVDVNAQLGDMVRVTTAGGLTVTLPEPTTLTVGSVVGIYKGPAGGTVTVRSMGSASTIDGATSVAITTAATGALYVSTGSEWFSL